jgi:hypothetical protein
MQTAHAAQRLNIAYRESTTDQGELAPHGHPTLVLTLCEVKCLEASPAADSAFIMLLPMAPDGPALFKP